MIGTDGVVVLVTLYTPVTDPVVALVGQPKPPVTLMGAGELVAWTVEGLPLVQVPASEAGAVGATTTLQEASPLVWMTIPPVGTLIEPEIGEPFWPVIDQLPLVVTVALTPHMLVEQPVKVGALIGTVTGPLGLVLFGAAGTVPVAVEVLQVMVTPPATALTTPWLVACTAAPAGLTVVEVCAAAGPIPNVAAATAHPAVATAARAKSLLSNIAYSFGEFDNFTGCEVVVFKSTKGSFSHPVIRAYHFIRELSRFGSRGPDD
ncbi:hypothetical protein [Nocardia asteroides]